MAAGHTGDLPVGLFVDSLISVFPKNISVSTHPKSHLVVTRVRSTTTKCTRGRGCSGHPAFPTPSLGGRFINTSGAWRGEGVNVRLDVIASEAKQSILCRGYGLLRSARNDGLAL
jgi:hypothetical protein